MLQEVLLPRLGQTVEKAKIEKWRVREGDAVRKGDVLLEITTDKATLEVESFVEGAVLKIVAAAGEEIDVNAVVAYVGDPATDKVPAVIPKPVRESAPQVALSAPTGTGAAGAPAHAPMPAGKLPVSPRARALAESENVPLCVLRGSGPNGRIVEADVLAYVRRLDGARVSPTARILARERGVDLLAVRGTGVDGRIMKEDVERAQPASARAAPGKSELSAARRIIAERMSRSKREAPHFYIEMDVDMSAAVALREELVAVGRAVSYNDLIIRAVARGFAAAPALNATWTGDAIARFDSVDVSLAVALEDGLVTPVVRGVENLSLDQISAQSTALIDKARNRRLAPFEYEGGGITISNLGMFAVDRFVPIINPGQASILGVGRIAERPVAIQGGLAVRRMMTLSLSADHRVTDGATAARFLKAVKDALESPRESLL